MRGPVERITGRLPDPWRTIADWVLTIGIAIGFVLVVKAFLFNPYRIPSSSMEPTFHCAQPGVGCESDGSDRVIANRVSLHFRDPERGDIVVFNTPQQAEIQCGVGGVYVKRIIGLPGERISQDNGIVFINGERLDEADYLDSERFGGRDFPPVEIDGSNYFMMGDNRRQSCDSRDWGTVKRERMIGSASFVYWPVNRIGFR
jgi:signal peptidase I